MYKLKIKALYLLNLKFKIMTDFLHNQRIALKKMLEEKSNEINIIENMIESIDRKLPHKDKVLFEKNGMFPDSECDRLQDLFNDFGKIYKEKL